jgi:hypothetical protein
LVNRDIVHRADFVLEHTRDNLADFLHRVVHDFLLGIS